ncbi:MAG: transcription termination/antitermination protein NusG [bacterium]
MTEEPTRPESEQEQEMGATPAEPEPTRAEPEGAERVPASAEAEDEAESAPAEVAEAVEGDPPTEQTEEPPAEAAPEAAEDDGEAEPAVSDPVAVAEGDSRAVEAGEPPAEAAIEAVAEAAPSHPDMKWYVIHTYSGYETKVKAALEDRLQASPLQESFGKVLVPTEDVVEMRGGRRRVSSRKYYPGYILIQMIMNTDTWYIIKNTPKVTGFLGGTNDPTPLNEGDVQKILGQMRGEQAVKPKVEFEEGQNVQVVDGPFANFSGVVETVNHERGKVKIMVTIFGRPTPVELEFLQVEKI